jgi:pimeloyl-ACP methyl ester carboxylesterase
MPRSQLSRREPVFWCVATLTVAACSAAPESGQPANEVTGNPASMAPNVGGPPPTSTSPTAPMVPTAPVGPNPQAPVPQEDDPAPVGLDPGPAPGNVGGVGPDPAPAPANPSDPPVATTPEVTLQGECCSDGNCVCHGPVPSQLTDSEGPFGTDSIRVSTGTLFYPTDAEPPFAGLAIAAGFLNTGAEILDWGEFFASYGIVTIVTTTTGADFPDIRASKLARSIEELERLNAESDNPLSGAMSGRYGTSGYSMGGGGTTLAASADQTLSSSVGLAPWAPVGRSVSTPTLLMCGSTDTIAPCSMAEGAYAETPESTPKMLVVLPLVGHLTWLSGPTAPGAGGALALAFMKTFLEGDERWKSVLLSAGGDVTTNITE